MTGRHEVAIGLGSYACYLAVRHVVWTERGRASAERNAARLVALERKLGLQVEPRIQSAMMRWRRVVDLANAGYAAGNVAVSVGWLASLYLRHDADFRRERRIAVAAFTGALPVFLLLPTAPPRRQEGFVDTLAARGVDLDRPLLTRFYNPIAAMPSHHVAFAVVTGTGLALRSRHALSRAAACAYPPLVAIVVIATGNHFVLDVAAGAALGLLCRRLVR